MIFVTVGSSHFDALVAAVDQAVGQGAIDDKVLIQIGNGKFEPIHCEFFRTAPGLHSYYEQADLIVGHGGTGTTLEVLELGKRLISVSNPAVADNHQHEFLEALEKRHLVRFCRDLADLPVVIKSALERQAQVSLDLSLFFSTVVDDLDRLPRR